jgi:hypothetical protein
MKNNYPTYDPSDIESLLRHKAFEELSDDEKSLALELCGNEADYTSMRNTLLSIKDSFAVEEITPEESIKDALLERFHKTHSTSKKGAGLWSRLFPAERSVFTSPGFQLAGVAVIVIVFGVVFLNQDAVDTKETALTDGKSAEEMPAPPKNEITDEKTSDALNGPGEIPATENKIAEETVHAKDKLTDKLNIAEGPAAVGKTSVDELASIAENENFSDFNTTIIPPTDSTIYFYKKANAKTNENVARKKEKTKEERNDNMRAEPQADLYKEYESSHVTTTSSSGMATKNDIPTKKSSKSVSASDKPEMLDLLFTSL